MTTETEWLDYIRARASEGWRWGWEYNQQLKTDPLMWVTPISVEVMPDVGVWAARYTGGVA